MVRLLIDTDRTAEHQPGHVRGELTSEEIKKYVAMCLKPGERTGLDRCPNELTKTMTDEEFQIVKMWANEILIEDTSRQRATKPANILEPWPGGSRQGRCVALTCKRCTSSNRKLGDRAREFIGSTLTLKTPSTPCLKQRYGR